MRIEDSDNFNGNGNGNGNDNDNGNGNGNGQGIDETGIEIDEIIKVLVVGNAKCGKSSIIHQYISKSFDNKYKTTVGADFARKDLYIELPNQERIGVRLQLWDIAGQDRFQKFTRAYFANAKGVVIVCDVSREGTVDAVRNWKREISVWANESDCADIPVVLFANKSDLLTDPQDALKTGAIMERMCREEGIFGWWATSALTGDCLHEGFYKLLQRIIEKDFYASMEDSKEQAMNPWRVVDHQHDEDSDDEQTNGICCVS